MVLQSYHDRSNDLHWYRDLPDMIMYDDDINDMADEEFTSPAPRSTDPTSNMPPLDCAAWVVATP